MSQHVPAWKKIGLKLKYAKDTADDTPFQAPEPAATAITNGTSHAGAKRPRDDEPEPSNGSSKKKNKRSKPQDETSTDAPVVKGILSGSQSPTKTPAKKSVQFSAETKAEDGETGQNYFKAWAAGGQPHTPPKPSTETAVPETPESAEKPQESPAESKAKSKASTKDPKPDQAAAPTPDDPENGPSLSERRAAKAAKKAAKQSLKAQTQPQHQQAAAHQPPQTAYVQYLHQFAHDKPAWKFNKSKENHLLKSLWSTYRVPASYTPAIVSYVAGLQGAGARSRLVEGADEVLRDVAEKGGKKFEFSGYEEAETRREAYGGAVRGLRDGGRLSGEDAERAERAEAVLAQLLNHAPVPVAKPTTVTGAGGAKRIQFADEEKVAEPKAAAAKLPARRKRKARTDVSSDESSSDSSSSESESSDDGSDSESDSEDSSSQSSSEDDSDSDSD